MDPVDIIVKETELRERRGQLSQEKASIESRLSHLTCKVRGKILPREEYRNICEEQNRAKRALFYVNEGLAAIKVELSKVHLEKDFLKLAGDSVETPRIVSGLQVLREKYSQFAQDATRISSMRLMASQFVSELEEIIKKNQLQAGVGQ
jgi:hypothetical protein